jgi:hypothetical protein
MTERKAFKKIVRSRMERTGESYSTARRQVDGRRAISLPAALVPGYEEFGTGSHHESDLVARLLRQAGLDLSEPMVCGLGGGIGFLYAVFEYAAAPTPLLTIVAQHHPQPWAPAVLDRLGVPHTEVHSGATPAALTKLRRALDGGRAVLCTVDRFRLPWHGTGSPYDAADVYNVVVAGIEGDTVYVDDLAAHPHEIGVAEFRAAWAGHRKGRHQMRTLGTVAGAPNLPDATRDAVATTVAHLTGPVLGHSFDVNFGFSGMAKLAAELRDDRSKAAWSRRFPGGVPFVHAMVRLDECLERANTAPGATRPVYADFLDEAFGAVAAATEAAALFRESGRRWSELAATAADAATAAQAGTEPDAATVRGLYDEFAAVVEACLDAEQRAVELLRKVTTA